MCSVLEIGNGDLEMQDSWHRRHAIQIVAALPEDADDAIVVLDLARQLVNGFLREDQRPEVALERVRGTVVSLSSASKGASF
jgi:hypothetical protein